jgi:hypothetical protein
MTPEERTEWAKSLAVGDRAAIGDVWRDSINYHTIVTVTGRTKSGRIRCGGMEFNPDGSGRKSAKWKELQPYCEEAQRQVDDAAREESEKRRRLALESKVAHLSWAEVRAVDVSDLEAIVAILDNAKAKAARR